MVDNVLNDPNGKMIERILTKVAEELMKQQPISPVEISEVIVNALLPFHSHFDAKSTINQLETRLEDLEKEVAIASAAKADLDRIAHLEQAASVPVPDSSR